MTMSVDEAKTFLLTKRAARGKPDAAWTSVKNMAEKILGRTMQDVRGEADNIAKALLAKLPKAEKPVKVTAGKCLTCNGTGKAALPAPVAETVTVDSSAVASVATVVLTPETPKAPEAVIDIALAETLPEVSTTEALSTLGEAPRAW